MIRIHVLEEDIINFLLICNNVERVKRKFLVQGSSEIKQNEYYGFLNY